MQELWFLRSVRCLMLIDIYTKFREDSLNDFQVIEQTRVWQTDSQTSREKTMSPEGGDIKTTMFILLLWVTV